MLRVPVLDTLKAAPSYMTIPYCAVFHVLNGHSALIPVLFLPRPPGPPHLTIQIPRHRTPQPPSALPSNTNQILQIIAGREPKLPDEISRRSLEVSITFALQTGRVVLGAAKVCVARDAGGALEAL